LKADVSTGILSISIGMSRSNNGKYSKFCLAAISFKMALYCSTDLFFSLFGFSPNGAKEMSATGAFVLFLISRIISSKLRL